MIGSGYKWIASENGKVPHDAVPAGVTSTGEELYIGRTQYMKRIIPGKVHRSHECLYIPFEGNEVRITTYEVLVVPQRAQWVRTSFEHFPYDTVNGGHELDGSPVLVGRAYHAGDLIPAKIIPSKNTVLVSYNGTEIAKNEFEVRIML